MALPGLNWSNPYVLRDSTDLVAEWRPAEPVWQTFFMQSQQSRAIRIGMPERRGP